MASNRIHYLRRIRGTSDQWVHCGRRLGQVRVTTSLHSVTCLVCQRYIAKGLAFGFRPSQGLHEGDDDDEATSVLH